MQNTLRFTQILGQNQENLEKDSFQSKEFKIHQVGKYTWNTPDDILGTGKFGQVFLARAKNDPNQKFAIKVIQRTEDEIDIRVKNEMELLNSLQVDKNNQVSEFEESLIKCYDCFQTKNNYYIVFEYIEHSIDIENLIAQKSVNENLALLIFYQVLKGIKYIHDRNIVHRDIKPANILFLRKTGQVKIIDFGMSRLFDSSGTQNQSRVGSPIYMAPELHNNEEHEPQKVDLWSLGTMLYEMIYKITPFIAFDQDQLKSILKEFKKDKNQLKFQTNIPITNETRQIIQSCLIYNSENRFSAAELLDLEPFKTWNKGESHPNFKTNFKDLNYEEILKDFIESLDTLTIDSNLYVLDFENQCPIKIKKPNNKSNEKEDNNQGQIQQLQEEEVQNKKQEKQQVNPFCFYNKIFQITIDHLQNFGQTYSYFQENQNVYNKILSLIKSKQQMFDLDLYCLKYAEIILCKLVQLMGSKALSLVSDFEKKMQNKDSVIIYFDQVLNNEFQNPEFEELHEQQQENLEKKQIQQRFLQFLNESESYFKFSKKMRKSNEIVEQKLKKVRQSFINDIMSQHSQQNTKLQNSQSMLVAPNPNDMNNNEIKLNKTNNFLELPKLNQGQSQLCDQELQKKELIQDQAQEELQQKREFQEKLMKCLQKDDLLNNRENLQFLKNVFLVINIMIIHNYLLKLREEEIRNKVFFQESQSVKFLQPILVIYEFFKTQFLFDCEKECDYEIYKNNQQDYQEMIDLFYEDIENQKKLQKQNSQQESEEQIMADYKNRYYQIVKCIQKNLNKNMLNLNIFYHQEKTNLESSFSSMNISNDIQ